MLGSGQPQGHLSVGAALGLPSSALQSRAQAPWKPRGKHFLCLTCLSVYMASLTSCLVFKGNGTQQWPSIPQPLMTSSFLLSNPSRSSLLQAIPETSNCVYQSSLLEAGTWRRHSPAFLIPPCWDSSVGGHSCS